MLVQVNVAEAERRGAVAVGFVLKLRFGNAAQEAGELDGGDEPAGFFKFLEGSAGEQLASVKAKAGLVDRFID